MNCNQRSANWKANLIHNIALGRAVLENIIKVLVGIIVSGLAFFYGILHKKISVSSSKIDKLNTDLQAIRIMLASNYVNKTEHDRVIDKLGDLIKENQKSKDEALAKIEAKIDAHAAESRQNLGKIFDKLDQKADK